MPFSATRDLWLVLKARDEGTRALRSFSRDIRMVGDSVREANLRAARSALSNQLAQQKLTGASRADMLVTQRRITAIDDEIGKMRVHRASMEESRVSALKLSTALGGASSLMTAAGTAMVAAGALGAVGLKNLINSAIEYQRQSSLTRTQVEGFKLSLREVEDIGLRVAKAIGTPFEKIQPALFDIFSSMEVGAADAELLLKRFAKAAVAGQTDIQTAQVATIGIMNAFQMPISSVTHLLDLQFQLVQEGVGTYEEWTKRIGLVTPSAVRAGQSVETMTAALAATTRMGIPAARAATAVSRAFDAMSHPAAVKAMKNLGVAALDAKGNFRPLIDTLGDLRAALAKLPKAEQTKALLEVFKGAGGTIEARRFLQNMLLTPGNLELFKSIFEEMSTQSGSFEQAYAIMADTAATKSELLRNKWEALKITVGEALMPGFLKLVETLGSAVDWFDRLSPRTKTLISYSVAFGVALAVILGIVLLVVGGIAAFVAAIVTAGSALLVVLGIFTVVGVAITAFGIVLKSAWSSSKDFRQTIGDLGASLKDLWQNYIIPTAEAVKTAWDIHMKPRLEALGEVIDKKVMPIWRELVMFFNGEMMGSIKEIGNLIKDILVTSFEILGNIIEEVVIPAFNKAAQFYKDHKETIDQVIGAVVWAGKEFGKLAVIVGVILAAVFVGPIIAAILGFVAVMTLIILIVVKVVDGIKAAVSWITTNVPKAWDWVTTKTSEAWNGILNFFKGIWTAIVTLVKNGWNAIVAIFNNIMTGLGVIWNYFWTTRVGGLVKAVFEFVVAFITMALTAISLAFTWFWKMISEGWTSLWDYVSTKVQAAWTIITAFLTAVWGSIVEIAKSVWGAVAAFFTFIWEKVSAEFMGKWNMLLAFLGGIWYAIKAIASAVWGAVGGTVTDAMNKMWNTVTGVWNKIKELFSKSQSWLFEAGQNLLKGLIDGITNKIKDVTDIINTVTKKLKDFFPHSPAKVGPLSGRGGMFYAGQNMIKQLAQGMESVSPMLNVVSRSASTARAGLISGTPSGGGKTVNQTINIHTQELDPKRQSAELGWMLVGSS